MLDLEICSRSFSFKFPAFSASFLASSKRPADKASCASFFNLAAFSSLKLKVSAEFIPNPPRALGAYFSFIASSRSWDFSCEEACASESLLMCSRRLFRESNLAFRCSVSVAIWFREVVPNFVSSAVPAPIALSRETKASVKRFISSSFS